MLDLALIRAEPARVKAALARRGVGPEAVDTVVDLDGRWTARAEVREALRVRRRRISKEFAQRKRGLQAGPDGEPESFHAPDLEQAGREVARQLAAASAEIAELQRLRHEALLALPNLPATDVPAVEPAAEAAGDAGTAPPPPWPNDFAPLAHWDLIEMLGLAQTAARSAGRGFLAWRGQGARLVRGLVRFMLDVHTRERGYEEILGPSLATRAALAGSAHLPTLEDKMYAVVGATGDEAPPDPSLTLGASNNLPDPSLTLGASNNLPDPSLTLGASNNLPEAARALGASNDLPDAARALGASNDLPDPSLTLGASNNLPDASRALGASNNLPDAARALGARRTHDLFLAPRAEPHLANLYAGKVLDEAALPIRLVAAGSAFRRQIGGHGRSSSGLLRLHEFPTVEVYTFCRPDQSEGEFAHAVESAEAVLARLDVPHRRRLRSARALSHAAAKTVDLEVWAPGMGEWLEVAAISTFTDYQARRTHTRYRDGQGCARLVHTVGGAAVAVPRLVAAILENRQQADGAVELPEALVSYVETEVLRAPA